MKNLFDRAKLLFSKDREFRIALYDIMGFYPHNVDLYRIAFAHKSQEYKSKRTGNKPLNNERLEFLGDAVLETVVSDIVYRHFPTGREGFLTNTRSKIVSRESLGQIAKDLGIDRLIQAQTNARAHNSYLAGNSFEALMGAIYLDRGFRYAFRFVEKRIIGALLDLEGVAQKEVNFKSKLLEWSQKNRIRVDFKDSVHGGNNGNTPTFSTSIIVEGIFVGEGKGFSKKESHQHAAKDALTQLRRDANFLDSVFRAKEKRTAMGAEEFFVLPKIDEIEAELAKEHQGATSASERKHRDRGADRSERNEKAERNDRKERKDRTEKADRTERSGRGERGEKGERAPQAEKTAGNEKSVQPEKNALSDRPVRQERKSRPQDEAETAERKPRRDPSERKAAPAPKPERVDTIAVEEEVIPPTVERKSRGERKVQEVADGEVPVGIAATAEAISHVSEPASAVPEAMSVAPDDVTPAVAAAVVPAPGLVEEQPAATQPEPVATDDFIPIAMTEPGAERSTSSNATAEVLSRIRRMAEAAQTEGSDRAGRLESAGQSAPSLSSEPNEEVTSSTQAKGAEFSEISQHTGSLEETTPGEQAEVSAPSDHFETSEDTDVVASSDELEAAQLVAPKARRHGRRQSVAAFVNTELPAASQSHRADKVRRRDEAAQEAARQRAVERTQRELAAASELAAEVPETVLDSEAVAEAQRERKRERNRRRRERDRERDRARREKAKRNAETGDNAPEARTERADERAAEPAPEYLREREDRIAAAETEAYGIDE